MVNVRYQTKAKLGADNIAEHKQLGQMADSMKRWEGWVADNLGLIPSDSETSSTSTLTV